MHSKGNQFKRVIGAIRTGHPAVRTALLIRAIAPITKHIDKLLISARPIQNIQNPIIFITCPPRSGGTLVFQALASTLPSVFISNFHAILPSLGSKVQHHYGYRPKKFVSYNGYTSGILDVYEGNEFLDWLHEKEDEQKIRKEFIALVSKLDPTTDEIIVLKNARAASAISKLSIAVPEILFVRIKRDTAIVMESSLSVYHQTGNFHPIPRKLLNKNIDDPLEFAVEQISEIERDLDKQFESIPKDKQVTISYEEFCESPKLVIEQIAYDHLKLPKGSLVNCNLLDYLKPSSRKRVSDDEAARIRKILLKS